MTTKQKIWVFLGLGVAAVGGYALTKYLTRNVRHYNYLTVKLVNYTPSDVDWEKVQ